MGLATFADEACDALLRNHHLKARNWVEWQGAGVAKESLAEILS